MTSQFATLLVGSLGLFGFGLYLLVEDPSPGTLAQAHAALPGGGHLESCEACHAAEGLDAGCLSCHVEIGDQHESGDGFHAKLKSCASCHPEHHGAGFDLVAEGLAWPSEKEFDHPHVAFGLDAAHDRLGCDDCHSRALPVAVPGFAPRERTFLGLNQGCRCCHANVHGTARFDTCTECHTQEAFKPVPGFDHDPHLLLVNGHGGVACTACHPAGVEAARGKRCADCHDDPHRTEWDQDCESCHTADARPWTDATLQPPDHARTGFVLSLPHGEVACDACHRPEFPYAERFPAPPRPPEACATCHADPHAGQFEPRTCLACHEATRFKPSRYGVAEHRTWPLRYAHAKTECSACHRADEALQAVRFTGMSTRCADCHKDPHAGQFADQECTACHDEKAFVPARFGAERHDAFPLRHAHGVVACRACHLEDEALGARRFEKTPTRCADCHENPHAGQFAGQECTACHDEKAFVPARFGLKRHDSFPLQGAHRAVACRACHREDEALGARRFEETPTRCAACHKDVHGGQFDAQVRKGDCAACHRPDATSFRILPYDHGARTGVVLEGAHAEAACARCHLTKGRVRQYRGTPQACASCHDDVHRGQFGRRGEVRCDSCHVARGTWQDLTFDHARTRFPLDKAHAGVACAQCHPSVPQRDGSRVVQYKPLGTECRDCHEVK